MGKLKMTRSYKGKNPNIKYWKRVKNRHEKYLKHSGIKQNTPEWFEKRKGKCTGSVWSSALGLFEKKAGNLIKNLSKDRNKSIKLQKKLKSEIKKEDYIDDMSEHDKQKMNIYCDWGTYHESTAIYNFLENYVEDLDTDGKVKECGCLEGEKHFLASSPDGILIIKNKKIPIEVKCRVPMYFNKKTKEWNYMNKCKPFDKIPCKYVPQVYAHMYVTKSKECKFISWSPMNGCNIFDIKRNEKLMKYILYYIEKFYTEFVTKDEEPPENFFFEEKEYQEMLKEIINVKNNTPITKHTENLENYLMFNSWLFE
jgi:hypothetical protein